MEITLEAKPRSETGKGAARRTRRDGLVPAVIYGAKVEATPLVVDAREMAQALATEAGFNILINLKLDSNTTHFTMLREVQSDPIRGNLLHIDFVAIDRDVKLEADIPVHLVGEARGVKEGGVIEHHLWEIEVKALPGDVPPSFEVDISHLGIDDHIKVGELSPPEGVEVLTPPEEIIASVVEPQVIELPEDIEAAEAEAAAEAAEEGEVPEGEEAPEAKAEGEGDEASEATPEDSEQ